MEIHGGPTKRKRRNIKDLTWMEFWSPAELKAKEIEENRKISLANVALPLRTINTLEQCQIYSLGDLASKSLEELTAIPNMGYITIKKCVSIILAHGLEAKCMKGLKK